MDVLARGSARRELELGFSIFPPGIRVPRAPNSCASWPDPGQGVNPEASAFLCLTGFSVVESNPLVSHELLLDRRLADEAFGFVCDGKPRSQDFVLGRPPSRWAASVNGSQRAELIAGAKLGMENAYTVVSGFAVGAAAVLRGRGLQVVPRVDIVVAMSFGEQLSSRSADVYADFLLPGLEADSLVLDCGTGEGAIAVGIALHVRSGRVVAVDRDGTASRDAITYARTEGIENLHFLGGDARRLPFGDDTFDVVHSHSMLETFADPVPVLREMRRVLRPGGLVAVASVEYSGVICSGPRRAETERFYALKEKIWQLDGLADPRNGQNLRSFVHAAGFKDVEATAKYIPHGTTADVRAFGRGRAADCSDHWFTDAARRHRLCAESELEVLREAWLEWSESPDAFAAFSWCRAIGRKA